MGLRYFAGLSWAPGRGVRPILGVTWCPSRKHASGAGADRFFNPDRVADRGAGGLVGAVCQRANCPLHVKAAAGRGLSI
jgi:hypothetical protein